jgi:hypothetical protein
MPVDEKPIESNDSLMVVEIVILVYDFFEHDRVKTKQWFRTRNPQLGFVSPNTMIRDGRSRKLLQWVITQMNENQPS